MNRAVTRYFYDNAGRLLRTVMPDGSQTSVTYDTLGRVVKSIAPDVPVMKIMWGTIPYVICMMLAIVILCFFPEIATWLPDTLMGPAKR